jgi:hypothetical protein
VHAPVSSTRPGVERSLIERERENIYIYQFSHANEKAYKNESSVVSGSLSLSPLLAQLPMGSINQQTEKTKTKNKLPNSQTPKLFLKHSGYIKH